MVSLFKKPITETDPISFNLIMKHSQDIIDSLLSTEFHTPSILGSSKGEIHYEFFHLTDRFDEIWISGDLSENSFIYVGRMLFCIHKSLGKNLLHGDFVLHNIFYNKYKELCVIDCHPPEVIGFNYTYLYGNQNLEMYLFLMNLSSSYGLRASLSRPKEVRQAIKNFRYGYGCVNDSTALLFAIFRMYKIRRAGNFSVFNAIAHAAVGLFFIVSSYE